MCKILISLRLPKVLLVGKNMLYVWGYPGDVRGQCTVSIYRVKSITINCIIQIFYIFIYSDLPLSGRDTGYHYSRTSEQGKKEKKHFEVNPLKERQNFMQKVKKRFYWNYMVRNEAKYSEKNLSNIY